MSQPPQKPGPGSPLDLRSRLGLKPGATPAPQPAPGPGQAPPPFPARLPSDAQGAPVPVPPALPTTPTEERLVFPPGQPAPAPGPLRLPPPDAFLSTEDEATRPAQLSPGLPPPPAASFPAAGQPSAGPPALPEMDPLAFLTQAPPVRQPEPVPAIVAPRFPDEPATDPGQVAAQLQQPPVAVDPFAAPYATAAPVPAYPYGGGGPLITPDLLSPEAAAAPLSPRDRRLWKILGIGGAVALLVVGLIGYMLGQVGKDREIINRRIDNAKTVLKAVSLSAERLRGIFPEVQRLDPDKPDYKLAEKLKSYTSAVNLEEIMGDHLLLGRAITADLMRFSSLAGEFQEKARRHGTLTATRHKAYLEKIVSGNDAMQGDAALLIYFTPNSRPNQPPPTGHLVALAGDAVAEGKEIKVPVRPLTSPEVRSVDINLLISLDRSELLQSAGPNVMQLHVERVGELKQLAAEIDKMMDRLIESLKKEAGKEPVATF